MNIPGIVSHVWGLHWNWRVQYPVYWYCDWTGLLLHHSHWGYTHWHSVWFLRRIHHQVHRACQSHRTSLCLCHRLFDVPHCWNVPLVQYFSVRGYSHIIWLMICCSLKACNVVTAKFGRHLKWQVFLWKLVFRNKENWPLQNHEDVLQMHNIHAMHWIQKIWFILSLELVIKTVHEKWKQAVYM